MSSRRSNLKFGNFTSSFGRLRPKDSTKKRAARAAWCFPLNQSWFWSRTPSFSLSFIKIPVVSQRTAKKGSNMKTTSSERAEPNHCFCWLSKYADFHTPSAYLNVKFKNALAGIFMFLHFCEVLYLCPNTFAASKRYEAINYQQVNRPNEDWGPLVKIIL